MLVLFVSDSLQPHGLQHASLPCPLLSPGACSNSGPLSWWCHPTISSSVVPFSSCPQSFPASGSFPMSQLFASGSQSIGVSASTSVLPMNTQDWSSLGWTGWISLQSRGLFKSLQHHSSKASAFFMVPLSHSMENHRIMKTVPNPIWGNWAPYLILGGPEGESLLNQSLRWSSFFACFWKKWVLWGRRELTGLRERRNVSETVRYHLLLRALGSAARHPGSCFERPKASLILFASLVWRRVQTFQQSRWQERCSSFLSTTPSSRIKVAKGWEEPSLFCAGKPPTF